MNRRDALKGLACVPVVAAVGPGKTEALMSWDLGEHDFTIETYIYFEPVEDEWTMTLHNLKPGEYVHIYDRADHGMPCIFSHQTLKGAEVKLPGEFKVNAKVGYQTYKNVTMFNTRKVKVMA